MYKGHQQVRPHRRCRLIPAQLCLRDPHPCLLCSLDKRRHHLQHVHASSRSITCAAAAAVGAQLKALILDCDGILLCKLCFTSGLPYHAHAWLLLVHIDNPSHTAGVIVESEDIHREAYNAAFAHFKACTGNQQEPIKWSEEFYDDLQNKVGGGKAKMRWFFGNAALHSLWDGLLCTGQRSVCINQCQTHSSSCVASCNATCY